MSTSNTLSVTINILSRTRAINKAEAKGDYGRIDRLLVYGVELMIL